MESGDIFRWFRSFCRVAKMKWTSFRKNEMESISRNRWFRCFEPSKNVNGLHFAKMKWSPFKEIDGSNKNEKRIGNY